MDMPLVDLSKKTRGGDLPLLRTAVLPVPKPRRPKRYGARGEGAAERRNMLRPWSEGGMFPPSPSDIYVDRLSCHTSEGWLGQGRLPLRTGFCVNS